MRNFFRKPVGNVWKDYKLSAEESEKCLTTCIILCLKLMKKIQSLAEKAGIVLTPDQHLAIFNRIAPTYETVAQDYLSSELAKQSEKAKEQAQADAAKSK